MVPSGKGVALEAQSGPPAGASEAGAHVQFWFGQVARVPEHRALPGVAPIRVGVGARVLEPRVPEVGRVAATVEGGVVDDDAATGERGDDEGMHEPVRWGFGQRLVGEAVDGQGAGIYRQGGPDPGAEERPALGGAVVLQHGELHELGDPIVAAGPPQARGLGVEGDEVPGVEERPGPLGGHQGVAAPHLVVHRRAAHGLPSRSSGLTALPPSRSGRTGWRTPRNRPDARRPR